jgi:tripartite-type tricarboxylate transporter receptor subunit TctC
MAARHHHLAQSVSRRRRHRHFRAAAGGAGRRTTRLPDHHRQQGRGFAVATPKRAAESPDISAAAEVGVPDWIVSTWYGLWAIKGTPEPIVDRMYREMVKAMETPELQAIWKGQTAEKGGESPADFAKRIRAEIEKWQKVVTAAGVKLD